MDVLSDRKYLKWKAFTNVSLTVHVVCESYTLSCLPETRCIFFCSTVSLRWFSRIKLHMFRKVEGRWGRKMWKTNYYLMLHDRFAVRGALVWACTVSCVLWEERRNGRVKVLMMLHVLFKSFRLDVHSIRCAPCSEGLSRNWWWFRSCLSSIVGGEFKKWSCLLGVCFLLVMYM